MLCQGAFKASFAEVFEAAGQACYDAETIAYEQQAQKDNVENHHQNAFSLRDYYDKRDGMSTMIVGKSLYVARGYQVEEISKEMLPMLPAFLGNKKFYGIRVVVSVY